MCCYDQLVADSQGRKAEQPPRPDWQSLFSHWRNGLGYETVKALAAKNARIFLTYRDLDKYQQ